MSLSAMAIDDEPDALEIIRILAEKVPFLHLQETFTNAFTGMEYVQKNEIDLLFLDIKMPDITGIELLKSLPSAPMVIFTTAYSQYAVEGFELSAIDYLLKPFSLARFVKACNKALENKQMRSKDPSPYIFIKTGYEEEKIMLEDIQYIEADGNYLTYILTDRKLLSRQNMMDAVNLLPDSKFIRIHRSYIIAIAAIQKISRFEIVVGEKTIPVGVSYEDRVVELRASLKK